MASVGEILSGAFRLFKEKPVTVAAWGGVFLAIGAVSNILPYAIGMDPGVVPTEPPNFGAAMAGGLVGMIVMLAYTAVMMCAVFRANLRPEQSSFASIRFGMDELRAMGLMVLLVIGVILMWLVALLGMMILVAGAAITGSAALTILMTVLVYVGILVGSIYLMVRLSLMFATTFVRQRLAVDDAWALSRGNFWTLFLTYLVLVVLALVLYSVVLGPFMQPYFAAMMEAMRNPEAATELAVFPIPTIGTIIAMTVASAVVQTILHTVNGSATATAVRLLMAENGEVLDDEVERTGQIFE